ncbi:GNAT family N-acetyltransferase [Acinetobacter pittii]|uniref:GNAT family N-acetyltransferase n=1 Tax=Acinetobacter pittii TaxID=48296 RepID=A0A3G6YNX9_ACIPI|nr:GNAT family N-acetyltransferase [Acinetobacter pittii]AZC01495.1 GNAT family N-acetyltransferase [Acinetobacter pittii]MCH2020166.1 GNAT family N-acetyltransferase [Acinetobacter pittii]WPP75451.1 GNAT family N-acetyltransferase [Acinetobacter pittii]
MTLLPCSKYSIRAACISDIDQLILIEKSASKAFLTIPDLAWIAESNTITPELHVKFISDFYSFVAIDESNQPVGFLYSKKYNNDLYILEVDVDQTRQKQGIGRQLINALINKAKKERMRQITLTTFMDVAWNQIFYEKLGFKIFTSNSPDYLIDILNEEISAGFHREGRCAMYLEVSNTSLT